MRPFVQLVYVSVMLACSTVPLVAQHVASGQGDIDSRDNDALLDRRITVELKGVSLERAIQTAAALAHTKVLADHDALMRYDRSVTLRVSDKSLREVFQQLFAGTTLQLRTRPHEQIIVTDADQRMASDSVPNIGTIVGHVVDSVTGRGLGNVAIQIAGTKLAVLTRDSGQFTLAGVPSGDQVVTAKLFGYRLGRRVVTITANERTTLRFALIVTPNVLSGVVTTATGVQRRLEVGSDITTLNVDSVMRVAPISSVTDLLETRVPGLTVLHSSGSPGDPARLRLRGTGSIQLNNDPIVIVDGIRVYASQSDSRNKNLAEPKEQGAIASHPYVAPSPLDQIDPSSIATIGVMKGPSATAIYGSDAANGVIVITTKRGSAGPAHWDVALAAGVNWLPGDWPTNYYRFGTTTNSENIFCPWYQLDCTLDSTVAFQALNDSRYTLFGRGNDQQASATISGGVPTLTYSVTGSASQQLGYLKLPASEVKRYDSLYGPIPRALVRPDQYPAWGVNGSLTAVPNTSLQVTLQSSLFNTTQRKSSLNNAISPLSVRYLSPELLVGPLISREYQQVVSEQTAETNALSLSWAPRPWLPFTASGGVNTMQRNDHTYVPYGVFDGPCSTDPCDTGGDTTGWYGLGRGTSKVTTVNVATTMPMFQQKLALSVGGNFYSTSTADFSVSDDYLSRGVSVPTTFIRVNGTGCNNSVPTQCYAPTDQSTTNQSTYGWFLEPKLNFASRFFVAPGFRLDGGSGGTKSSGNFSDLSAFPKMNLSYLAVDRQSDDPLWGVVSLFRPRLSFGFAGTQPSPADKLRLYNIGAYQNRAPGQGALTGGIGLCEPVATIDGINTVEAVCLNSVGNTALHPERSRELEGGADASLWQGRLAFTYTLYNKTRYDAIVAIPIAQSVVSNGTGSYLVQKNVGVIRNTGTEVTLDATLLEQRSLGWTVSANLFKNNNMVVRLNRDQPPIVMNTVGGDGYNSNGNGLQTRVQAGYPLDAAFARPILGYSDANQDGVIEVSEVRYGDSVVYVGQPNPNYELNLTNSVTLFDGRLGVHMTFAYQNGMTQFNTGACGNAAFLLIGNAPNTPLATQAAAVAAGCGSGVPQSVIGLIQTVNTFRFNDLSVNYNIPSSWSRRVRIPQMSVALQGSNLVLHTNYRGKDPNVNAFSTVSAGDETIDTGQIPEPRTWWLRVRVGN